MYKSEQFGRIFWADDNYDLQSCPLNEDETGDFDNADYVSEWDDFTDVEVQLLLNIYKCELVNKVNYANSLTTKEVKYGARVFQKNFDWFVSYRDETASFWDGMILLDSDSLQIA